MSDPQPVRFRPVEDEEDAASTEAEDRRSPSPPDDEPVREAERDPYPLAGPILEGTRSTLLRGRCSACEARLRVRLDERKPLRVRCPICGNTRRIEP